MARFGFTPGAEVPASISEDHGIEALYDTDLEIYSVGVSTGGVAEMRMAANNLARHIIASTIDAMGLDFARQRVEQSGLRDKIDLRLEDITKPLPYADGHFDYAYARLVLHYLSKQQLPGALEGLYRVLKPGGRLFAVVRSTESHDTRRPGATTDPETMLTSYTFTDPSTKRPKTVKRYFHEPESIAGYIQDAGFNVSYASSYQEQIYVDFMRRHPASEPDHVIEVMASKPR